MSATNEQRFAEAQEWLTKASVDLRAAEAVRGADPPVTEDMVFHAQQIVEKVLKAYLAWHDIPFRKTHSLVELGEACARLDPTLEPILKEAAPLSEYASKFRYPGAPESPDLAEADRALATALRVREAIVSRLPKSSPRSEGAQATSS